MNTIDDDKHDPILRHLLATAGLLQSAVKAFEQQCDPGSHRALLAALAAGAMLRATTTISLAGAMGISFDLVAHDGEPIRIGHVDFDGDRLPLN